MSEKAWKLVLAAVVLALALPGSLAAEEAAVPEVALEVAPDAAEAVTPAPAEPALPDLQPAPLPMTDCYSLSTCTTTFAACENWCYAQYCGVHSWDPVFQICNCGTQM